MPFGSFLWIRYSADQAAMAPVDTMIQTARVKRTLLRRDMRIRQPAIVSQPRSMIKANPSSSRLAMPVYIRLRAAKCSTIAERTDPPGWFVAISYVDAIKSALLRIDVD